jgi:methylmalonyl-CoA mutase cobalamin-binding domain/chain
MLGREGLRRFQLLQADAVSVVTERFCAALGSAYDEFDLRGRAACREDLAFHLEFLQPVLEFGLLQPMVDYLRWLASVLAARSIPVDHLASSLDMLGAFFAERMDAVDGAVVIAALHAARTKFMEAENESPPSDGGAWPETERFELALLAGHQREALSIVNDCIDGGHDLVDVEQHIIKPALYHIGEKWQANKVTVAAEHLATAIAQSVMTIGMLRSTPPAMIGRRVLLACVAGNLHALGLRMVADAFELAGWDVQYLGANVPTPAIVRHVDEWNVDLVGLSVSFAQQLPVVKQVIGQLNERLGPERPAVIVGGLTINRFSQLAEMVGADACGVDAPSAVTRANELIAG